MFIPGRDAGEDRTNRSFCSEAVQPTIRLAALGMDLGDAFRLGTERGLNRHSTQPLERPSRRWRLPRRGVRSPYW